MTDHIFSGLDGTPRSDKPRNRGLTMVVDWGIGHNAQQDLIDTGGPYMDFAKIAVGLSRLLPNDALRAKIAAYRENDIETFPGGMFLEYAAVQGKDDIYLPAVVEAGYKWVEVSDNLAPVSLDWKQATIRRAAREFQLKVFGEVGKKEGLENTIPLVDNARGCLDAGASIILLEAAELVSDDPGTAEAVEEIVRETGLDRVMFELPGPWIEGVTLNRIARMRDDLIGRFGPQVNLGNVNPDDLLTLEAYRRGLGVNAGGPTASS